MNKELKDLLKKAFDEGAMYEATLSRACSFNSFIDDNIEQLKLYGVSNRLETTCAKAEPLIIEMNKDHLVELYNFAYEQAVKTGKVDELKEIDAKLNGC